MPMDGFSLSFLQRELRSTLLGGRVDKVNQPERDTLLLMIRSGSNHKLLLSTNASQARVQLTSQTYENPIEPPMFCMVMRKHLLGAHIIDIQQISGDRILAIVFSCIGELGDHVNKTLYLELMGRHSNLTLVTDQGVIVDSIRHVNSEMSRVRTVLPNGHYHLPPQPDKLTPDTLSADALAARLLMMSCSLSKGLMACVAGMASVCANEACAQVGIEATTPIAELNMSIVAPKLTNFYANAEKNLAPVVLSDDAGQATDFFPFPYLTFSLENQKPRSTLSAAMDAFYLGRDLRQRMQQKGAGLQKHIKTALERTEKKKSIMLETLANTDKIEQDRIYGDLLTASLHLISKGQDQAIVQNYYEQGSPEIIIPLSNQKTPSQNAQAFYKKYRKAKTSEQYAKEQLVIIDRDLILLESALDDLDKCETTTDMAEVRFILTENGFVRPDSTQRKKKKLQEGKPYRFIADDGTQIDVGKNSLQNDRLTLHARANETWLHAQGIPGSHVLLRTEAEPSDETLLFAAKIAAYYSKGRNHPALPIDYTKRKYVKKAANSVAGLVTYNNFQTILIGLTPEDVVRITKGTNHEGTEHK